MRRSQIDANVTMKKLFTAGFMLIAMSSFTYSLNKAIVLTASYFLPADQVFRDVYGGGAKFGIEADIEVAKNISLWVGVDYFKKNGKMTVTQDETKARMIPISVGINYGIPLNRRLKIYVGGGFQYVIFKEENYLGFLSDRKLGSIIKSCASFSINKQSAIDFFLTYSVCKMKHGEIEFKTGGYEAGGGLRLIFHF